MFVTIGYGPLYVDLFCCTFQDHKSVRNFHRVTEVVVFDLVFKFTKRLTNLSS